MISRYGKRPVGQVKSIVSRLTAGLNEYNSSNIIGDNFLSECWGCLPYQNEAVKMLSQTSNSLLGTNTFGDGIVYGAIADKVPTDSYNESLDDHVILITRIPSTPTDVLDYLYDVNITQDSITPIDISASAIPYSGELSMCLFFTEVIRYVCFVNSRTKKLFYYNYTSVGSINLPFYPKKIVSHVNRIFVTDINNKLWWCRAGDISSWYGLDVDDDFIVVLANMANSTYIIANQPDVPRYISATVVKNSTIDTLGTIAVVGTSSQDVAQTETLTPIDGTVYTKYAYKTLTSLTQSGWTGVAGTDKIKFGSSVVAGGFVQDDAGYWTLEKESVLNNMAVLSNNLYVWSNKSIYVFRGYSYDTFSCELHVSNVGCDRDVVVSNNVAYFTYDHNLYEFNGVDHPRIINRPVHVNGQLSNGVLGGFGSAKVSSTGITYDALALADPSLYGLAATNEYLYFYWNYPATRYNSHDYQGWIYVFKIKDRSWWQLAGFSADYNTYLKTLYIPNGSLDDMYNIQSTGATSAVADWAIYTNPGLSDYGGAYFVTKTFSEDPSDLVSLTNLILQLRANSADVSLQLYYSLVSVEPALLADTDWTLLWSCTNEDYNTDIQNITINLAGSEIARASNYRLKLVTDDTNGVYVYGIERRYRILGRSR